MLLPPSSLREELWVGPLLCSAGGAEGCSLCVSLVAAWLARRVQRRDEGSVDCKHCSFPTSSGS